jgi:uncharacterized membrane protein
MHNLTILAFDNPNQAFQVRDALLNLQGESLFDLAELAVVTRDESGKVTLHQPNGSVGGCASAGSVVGLILGAIFAVPWAGSAVGAGIGAVVGALTRFGIDLEFIKELGSTITPGTSALAILGSKAKLDELGKKLGALLRNTTILRTNVDPERESEIRELLLAGNDPGPQDPQLNETP